LDPIRHVLIVGGGSSGWMAASLLNRVPNLHVTLVEASDIPIIGVGESTNVTTTYFHLLAGVDEKAFMRASNAAYKIAIRFVNFNHCGGVFLHPFGEPPDTERSLFRPCAQAHYVTCQMAAQHTELSKAHSYAYQLDAGLYGEYLKQRSKRATNPIRHVVDRVEGVELNANGDIASIRTAQSGPLSADLYIDCSGFRALLMDKTLHEPFHPVQKYLLNDRAIAARVPYQNRDAELKTYTNCVGLSAGWVWEIPLWSRLGTGYVYSSAFLSPSAAEEEFRRYLGEDRIADVAFNHIEIRAGRHERAWVRNCVGIGVSYGFLEPLESTGLSLTQIAIIDLAKVLAHDGGESARAQFNRRQAEIFDTTRDFVTAHFALTSRDDTPYWRQLRYDAAIPDSLQEVLDAARAGSYEPIDRLPNTFYRKLNWNVILSGMGFFNDREAAVPSLPRPATRLHSSLLRDTIYDAEAPEPVVQPMPVTELAHPVWFPTW
jgi:hypothetical protein